MSNEWIVFNASDPVWLGRIAGALYAYDNTGDPAAPPFDHIGVPDQRQYIGAAVAVVAAMIGAYPQ